MTATPTLLGKYRTPRFKYGDVVHCARLGDVVITGFTEAPVRWPLCKPIGSKPGKPALVLYRDLVKAVRRESAEAVSYHWGVSMGFVWKLRKALGVGTYTPGTLALRNGRVAEAVRQAHLGTTHSDQTRARMGNTHRRRGTRPPLAGRPWTPDEDELVRTRRAPEVAVVTGRTLKAVYDRRRVLKMPDGRA